MVKHKSRTGQAILLVLLAVIGCFQPSQARDTCYERPWQEANSSTQTVTVSLATFEELQQYIDKASGPTIFVIKSAQSALTAKQALEISKPDITITAAAELLTGSNNSSSGTLQLAVDCAHAGTLLHIRAPGFKLVGLSISGCNSSAVQLIGAKRALVRKCNFAGNTADELSSGGAAVSARRSQLWLDSCTFSSNAAMGPGGALAMTASQLLVTDCSFVGNSAEQVGGAVSLQGRADATIVGSTPACWRDVDGVFEAVKLRRNTAALHGGALATNGSHVVLAATTATGNTARYGGVLYAGQAANVVVRGQSSMTNNSASSSGGVVYALGPGVHVVLQGSTFAANSAEILGGVLSAKDAATVKVVSSTFSSNSAQLAAGVLYSRDADLTAIGSTFSSNSASRDGGALYCAGTCNWLVKGSKFRDNKCGANGGAVFGWNLYASISTSSLDGNAAGALGGAISVANSTFTMHNSSLGSNSATGLDAAGGGLYSQGSRLNLTNCTMTANKATWGGAVYVTNSTLSVLGGAITNSSVSGSGAALYVLRSPTALVDVKIQRNDAAQYGGSLYCHYSTCSMLGCDVSLGTAALGAGCIWAGYGSLSLRGSHFEGCIAKAEGGGALHAISAVNVTIVGCSFTSCSALKGEGGGLELENVRAAAVNGTMFAANQALSGGSVSLSNSSISISGSSLYKSTATVGGCLAATAGSSITLYNGTAVAGNSAAVGGGIAMDDSSLTVISPVAVAFNKALVPEVRATSATGAAAADVPLPPTADFAGQAVLRGLAGGIYAHTSKIMGSGLRLESNEAKRVGGGGYWDRCSVRLSSSSISKNTAMEEAGGLKLVNPADGTSLTACSIAANWAGVRAGGLGIVAVDLVSELALVDVQLVNNTAAGEAGGGLLLTGPLGLLMQGGEVSGNAAGAAAATDALATVGLSTTDAFTASSGSGFSGLLPAGGGVLFEGCSWAALRDVDVWGNAAPSGCGGGVAVNSCGRFKLDAAMVEGNVAASGGGVCVTGLPGYLVLHNTSVSSNRALLGGVFSGSGSGLSPTPEPHLSCRVPGTGGGLCIEVQGHVLVNGSSISRNQARNGGAMALGICEDSERCALGMFGANFTNNTAVQGGGGALYFTTVVAPAQVLCGEDYNSSQAVGHTAGTTFPSLASILGKLGFANSSTVNTTAVADSSSAVSNAAGAPGSSSSGTASSGGGSAASAPSTASSSTFTPGGGSASDDSSSTTVEFETDGFDPTAAGASVTTVTFTPAKPKKAGSKPGNKKANTTTVSGLRVSDTSAESSMGNPSSTAPESGALQNSSIDSTEGYDPTAVTAETVSFDPAAPDGTPSFDSFDASAETLGFDPSAAATTESLDPAATAGFDPTAAASAESLSPTAAATEGFDPTATASSKSFEPPAAATEGFDPTATASSESLEPSAAVTEGFDPTATASSESFEPSAAATEGFDPTATASSESFEPSAAATSSSSTAAVPLKADAATMKGWDPAATYLPEDAGSTGYITETEPFDPTGNSNTAAPLADTAAAGDYEDGAVGFAGFDPSAFGAAAADVDADSVTFGIASAADGTLSQQGNASSASQAAFQQKSSNVAAAAAAEPAVALGHTTPESGASGGSSSSTQGAAQLLPADVGNLHLGDVKEALQVLEPPKERTRTFTVGSGQTASTTVFMDADAKAQQADRVINSATGAGADSTGVQADELFSLAVPLTEQLLAAAAAVKVPLKSIAVWQKNHNVRLVDLIDTGVIDAQQLSLYWRPEGGLVRPQPRAQPGKDAEHKLYSTLAHALVKAYTKQSSAADSGSKPSSSWNKFNPYTMTCDPVQNPAACPVPKLAQSAQAGRQAKDALTAEAAAEAAAMAGNGGKLSAGSIVAEGGPLAKAGSDRATGRRKLMQKDEAAAANEAAAAVEAYVAAAGEPSGAPDTGLVLQGTSQCGTFEDNTAIGSKAYGPVVTSRPAGLRVWDSSGGLTGPTPVSVATGGEVTVQIQVVDVFGGVVTSGATDFIRVRATLRNPSGGSSSASSSLTGTAALPGIGSSLPGISGPSLAGVSTAAAAADSDAETDGNEVVLSGSQQLATKNGSLVLSGIMLSGPPGTNTTLYFRASDPSLLPASVPVSLTSCSAGYMQLPGSCQLCPTGTFSFSPDEPRCALCPTNAVCNGTVLVPNSGYWQSSPRSSQIHACINPAACARDNTQKQQLMDWQAKNFGTGLMVGRPKGEVAKAVRQYMQNQCAPGYTGTLCSNCAQDPAAVAANRVSHGKVAGTCVQCGDRRTVLGMYILARLYDLALWAALTWLAWRAAKAWAKAVTLNPGTAAATSGSLPPSSAAAASLSARMGGGEKGSSGMVLATSEVAAAAAAGVGTSAPLHAHVGVFLDYLQMLSIISCSVASYTWPKVLQTFMTGFTFVPLGTSKWVSVDCLLPYQLSYRRSIVSLLVTAAVPLFYLTVAAGVWIAGLVLGKTHRTPILALVVGTGLFYPLITMSALNAFSCNYIDSPSVGAGEIVTAPGSYWSLDPELKCYQGQHLQLMLGFGLPVVLLVVLAWPLLLASMLWDSRFRIREQQQHPATRRRYLVRKTIKLCHQLLGVMSGFIRPRMYLWPVLVEVRKLLLCVVVVLASGSEPAVQLYVLWGLLALVLLLEWWARARSSWALMGLQLVAIGALQAVVYLAAAFTQTALVDAAPTFTALIMCVALSVAVGFLLSLIAGLRGNSWFRKVFDADNDGKISKGDLYQSASKLLHLNTAPASAGKSVDGDAGGSKLVSSSTPSNKIATWRMVFVSKVPALGSKSGSGKSDSSADAASKDSSKRSVDADKQPSDQRRAASGALRSPAASQAGRISGRGLAAGSLPITDATGGGIIASSSSSGAAAGAAAAAAAAAAVATSASIDIGALGALRKGLLGRQLQQAGVAGITAAGPAGSGSGDSGSGRVGSPELLPAGAHVAVDLRQLAGSRSARSAGQGPISAGGSSGQQQLAAAVAAAKMGRANSAGAPLPSNMPLQAYLSVHQWLTDSEELSHGTGHPDNSGWVGRVGVAGSGEAYRPPRASTRSLQETASSPGPYVTGAGSGSMAVQRQQLLQQQLQIWRGALAEEQAADESEVDVENLRSVSETEQYRQLQLRRQTGQAAAARADEVAATQAAGGVSGRHQPYYALWSNVARAISGPSAAASPSSNRRAEADTASPAGVPAELIAEAAAAAASKIARSGGARASPFAAAFIADSPAAGSAVSPNSSSQAETAGPGPAGVPAELIAEAAAQAANKVARAGGACASPFAAAFIAGSPAASASPGNSLRTEAAAAASGPAGVPAELIAEAAAQAATKVVRAGGARASPFAAAAVAGRPPAGPSSSRQAVAAAAAVGPAGVPAELIAEAAAQAAARNSTRPGDTRRSPFAAQALAAAASSSSRPTVRGASVPGKAQVASPVVSSVHIPAAAPGRHSAYYNLWQSAVARLSDEGLIPPTSPSSTAPPAAEAHVPTAAGPVSALADEQEPTQQCAAASGATPGRHTQYINMWQAVAEELGDGPSAVVVGAPVDPAVPGQVAAAAAAAAVPAEVEAPVQQQQQQRRRSRASRRGGRRSSAADAGALSGVSSDASAYMGEPAETS